MNLTVPHPPTPIKQLNHQKRRSRSPEIRRRTRPRGGVAGVGRSHEACEASGALFFLHKKLVSRERKWLVALSQCSLLSPGLCETFLRIQFCKVLEILQRWAPLGASMVENRKSPAQSSDMLSYSPSPNVVQEFRHSLEERPSVFALADPRSSLLVV